MGAELLEEHVGGELGFVAEEGCDFLGGRRQVEVAGDRLGNQQCLKWTCADPESEGLTEDSELLNDDKGGQTAACRYNSECLDPLICRFGVCEVECQSTRS